MSQDLIIKCLIAFFLGIIAFYMMLGNGLMVGGQVDCKNLEPTNCSSLGENELMCKMSKESRIMSNHKKHGLDVQ